MTFLAPWFLLAAVAVAAAIVALHFIVTRQPRAALLPTARFVPDTPATTVAPARRPSDLLLMFLRVLVVLAAGAGLAKPVVTARRGAMARVILVDVSRSLRDSMAIRDSVRALYRNGDALVLFDSSTRVVAGDISAAIDSLRPTTRRGNLSAALIAALRAGSGVRDRADSIELVLVSPFAREELDAATDSIRNLWKGKVRLVRLAEPATESATPTELSISAEPSDPLNVTIPLARERVTGNGKQETGNGKRVTSSDGQQTTANALIDRAPVQSRRRSTDAGVLIAWPASSRPRFAAQRPTIDTIGGVISGEEAVVAAFERRWRYPPDSLQGGEVVARWVDGEPAAIEKSEGQGCVRSVAIPVTPVGDLAIRNEFVRLVSSLSRPCVRVTSSIPADPALVSRLEGKGGLAPREAFHPATDAKSPLAPWLFALALAAAIAELFVRRSERTTNESQQQRSQSSEARAA